MALFPLFPFIIINLSAQRSLAYSPHVILIDAMMPDLDAYQFSYLVRTFRPDSGIKLVLMDLKSNDIDLEKFNEENFFERLLKPFTREELLSVLVDENQTGSNNTR